MRKLVAVILSLLTLGFLPKTSAQQATLPKTNIALPNEPWILAFDLKDFSVKTNDPQPDGRSYLLAENQKSNVTLSVYLERVQGVATAEDCAETRKQRLDEKVDYKREKIETREADGMTILEFTIPEMEAMPIQQRNLFACVPKDDVYIDVHLSKALFKPQDEALFTAVLKSMSFVPKSLPAVK